MSDARDAFVRSIDVSPQMAHELIKALRQAGIPFVVAPYEADAQLAFLERVGLIDGIITEDSDLLVFGCNTVLFKLDTYGNCVEVRRDRFAEVKQVDFDGWGVTEFRQMAILSGCDYLPSIAGMGLRVAHRLMRRYESAAHVLRAVRLEGKMKVPPAYEEHFRRAELTFAHQRVWDPRGDGTLTTLEPLPVELTDELVPFIGEPLPAELARAIARGDTCPIDHKPLGAQARTYAPGGQRSIHSFFHAAPLAERDTNRPLAAKIEKPAKAAAPPAPRASPKSAHSSPVDVFDTFEQPTSSPVHTPPVSPSKNACNDDGVVSSPVSSPATSPVCVPSKRSAEAVDAERRRDWYERFSFSGARTRHVALPGTTPRAPVRRTSSETTPMRRTLQLTQRTNTTPAPAMRAEKAIETPRVNDTPRPQTPRSAPPGAQPGSGSSRLLRFRYIEPTTPT